MSYSPLPEQFDADNLPTHCTACGSRMKVKPMYLTPNDPQTGWRKKWMVVECPLHDGGAQGDRHHGLIWGQAWYHDGFKVKVIGNEYDDFMAGTRNGCTGKATTMLIVVYLLLRMVRALRSV